MDAPLTVQRELRLDLDADEVWALVSTREGWEQWLVDRAELSPAPGAVGEVVDDGVRRTVLVQEVVDRTRITFVWSETGAADDLSTVTLRVVDDGDGRARLLVTEEWSSPTACADCPLRAADRWDLRACVLCLGLAARCRV